MSGWIARGLRRGILTTRYPDGPFEMPERYRGRLCVRQGASRDDCARGAEACLSRAIVLGEEASHVRIERCFQCGECRRRAPDAFDLTNDYEVACVEGDVAAVRERLRARLASLGKSIFLRHVDAGSDASCDQELQALFNPFYDVSRLGIFLSAAPRHADVLAVTGVVTRSMADPLLRTYQAMPDPKVVIAVGSAAASGSIFETGPSILGPVDQVIPVDVKVPGAPPPPVAILHGLWVALGRIAAPQAAS